MKKTERDKALLAGLTRVIGSRVEWGSDDDFAYPGAVDDFAVVSTGVILEDNAEDGELKIELPVDLGSTTGYFDLAATVRITVELVSVLEEDD